MTSQMFSFIAVRGARPLAVDHWMQVRTKQPDVSINALNAEPAGSADPIEPFDRTVTVCLEKLSWWLLDVDDRRSVKEIETWLAVRTIWRTSYPTVSSLVRSDEYREARAAIANRARTRRSDELSVRLLLVCGLLERQAIPVGRKSLTSDSDVAGWLSSAIVVDDGPDDRTLGGASFTVPRLLASSDSATAPQALGQPNRNGAWTRKISRGLRTRFFRREEELDERAETPQWRPSSALVRPPAVGELIVVEQELCGYEAGEVADIENVLAGETKARRDRDLTVSQEELVEQSGRTTERMESSEQRDETKMRSEAENTISNDTRFEANLNVEAQYPPYVKVTADAGISVGTSSTMTDRASSEIAKEVTLKTSRRVAQEELTRRSSLQRRERERRFSHRFAGGTQNAIGVYCHVDAVWTARSVRYDPRLLCEFLIPEPATALRRLLADTVPPIEVDLKEPEYPQFDAKFISRSNWAKLVRQYGALGVSGPPDESIGVSRSFKASVSSDPKALDYRLAVFEVFDTLAVPEGYAATKVTFTITSVLGETAPLVPFPFTSNWVRVPGSIAMTAAGKSLSITIDVKGLHQRSGTISIEPTSETVAFSAAQHMGYGFSGTIRASCMLTPEAFIRWQSTVFSRILSAYQTSKQEYDAAVDEARRQADPSPKAIRSTDARRLIQTELRRLCLTMLAGPAEFPRHPTSNALVETTWGVPDRVQNALERERILFLEQAFDWSLIQYVPYPYFWAEKAHWENLVAADNGDAMLAEFQRAGAVRVLVPARKEFDQAVLRYLSKGDIWLGGHPPHDYHNPLYVSIALELAELRDRPREGVELESWQFRLPTPHVILDRLPACVDTKESVKEDTPAVNAGEGQPRIMAQKNKDRRQEDTVPVNG